MTYGARNHARRVNKHQLVSIVVSYSYIERLCVPRKQLSSPIASRALLGWCSSGLNGDYSQRCVESAYGGSAAGICPYNSWGTNIASTTCNSLDALCRGWSADGCEECIEINTSCGFCRGSNQCEYQEFNAPAASDCPVSSFAWAVGQCAGSGPNISDACNAYVGCEACSGARSDYQCGYCSGSGICSTGNSAGPTATTCPSGWALKSCPCDNIFSCGTCTQNAEWSVTRH